MADYKEYIEPTLKHAPILNQSIWHVAARNNLKPKVLIVKRDGQVIKQVNYKLETDDSPKYKLII